MAVPAGVAFFAPTSRPATEDDPMNAEQPSKRQQADSLVLQVGRGPLSACFTCAKPAALGQAINSVL